jgi:hypothetical protein
MILGGDEPSPTSKPLEIELLQKVKDEPSSAASFFPKDVIDVFEDLFEHWHLISA